MKINVRMLVVVIGVLFTFNSCKLFKGKGHSDCPAYGLEREMLPNQNLRV